MSTKGKRKKKKKRFSTLLTPTGRYAIDSNRKIFCLTTTIFIMKIERVKFDHFVQLINKTVMIHL